MTINFPYPAVAKVFYEFDGLSHVHNIGVRPVAGFDNAPSGLDPDGYELAGSDGVTVKDFQTWAEGYVNGFIAPDTQNVIGLKARFAPETTVLRVELWRYPQQSLTGQFMTSLDFGVLGTYLGANLPAIQRTYTFRSAEGSISKVVLMEGGFGDGTSQNTLSTLGNEEKRWLQWQYLSQTSCVLAKDGSRFVSFIKRSNGQNEALFRKRYR